MKLTNRNGYPEALLRAMENDPYDKGDAEFSISELKMPPRILALKQAHFEELEEDIDDRLWSLYGQLVHVLLERANRPDKAIAEKRYFGKIDGVKISGQVDTLDLDRGTLTDWKFQSSYKFKVGQAGDPEWIAQLNMQLELLRQNGLDASRLEIIGLLRDWSKGKARRERERGFPQEPVQRVAFAPWPREQTIAYMRERIRLHRAAQLRLPECTPEERWAKPEVYAVMKRGRKSALRYGLYASREEAEARVEREGASTHWVEFRPGESSRCQYCPVSAVCSQYAKLTESEPIPALATADEE